MPSTTVDSPETPADEAALLALLSDLATDVNVLRADEAGDHYQRDWTDTYGARVPVVRPRTPAAVAAVVSRLAYAGIRMAVQGGMTGLVGSGAPDDAEVVISLELLNRIEEVDTLGCTMTVEAGVPLEVVQQEAEKNGLFFPVDLGAKGTCHIGGTIATNAGGNRVLQYGMTRQSVLGLEVVLPDGTVLSRLGKVLKDNAGYDLKQLFIGSEGTLGIVTRAVLRLQPLPTSRHTALVAVDSLEQALKTLSACRTGLGPLLTSFEVMWRDYFNRVTQDMGVGRDPFDGKGSHLILVEMSGFDRKVERDETRFHETLESVVEEVGTELIVIAQSMADAADLWRIRESSGEAAREMGPFLSFDISIPSAHLVECMNAITSDLSTLMPDPVTSTYGHLGDCNIHLVVACSDAELASRIKHAVYGHVVACGGSLSAEHGIGRANREQFEAFYPAAQIDAMRRIRDAFDPKQLFNRGRVFGSPPQH